MALYRGSFASILPSTPGDRSSTHNLGTCHAVEKGTHLTYWKVGKYFLEIESYVSYFL
jgi:hypothetical protein